MMMRLAAGSFDFSPNEVEINFHITDDAKLVRPQDAGEPEWRMYFCHWQLVWPGIAALAACTPSAVQVQEIDHLPLPSSPHWEPIIMVFMIKWNSKTLMRFLPYGRNNLTELLSFLTSGEARQEQAGGAVPDYPVSGTERPRHWEGRAAGRKGRPAEKELSGSGGRNGALPPEPAFSRCLHPQRSCAGCPAACGAAGIH